MEINVSIAHPASMKPGRSYVMAVDVSPEGEWESVEEDYPVYINVVSDGLLQVKSNWPSVVVMHRFGGNYGDARFALFPQKLGNANLKIDFSNQWGVSIKSYSFVLPIVE